MACGKKMNRVERDLVEGLEGFLDDLKSDAPIEKKYTCRRVVLDLEPHAYTAEQVKTIRRLLNASQNSLPNSSACRSKRCANGKPVARPATWRRVSWMRFDAIRPIGNSD